MGNRKCLGSIKPLFTTAAEDAGSRFLSISVQGTKKGKLSRTSCYSLSLFFCGKVSFSGSLRGDSALGLLLFGGEMGLKDAGIPGNKKGGDELWGQDINVRLGQNCLFMATIHAFLTETVSCTRQKGIDLEYGKGKKSG